jgi:hypothetical protein
MREFKINGVEIPIDIPVCHREMYAEWVKRGKPQMELLESQNGPEHWVECNPAWCAGIQYRFKDSEIDAMNAGLPNSTTEWNSRPTSKHDAGNHSALQTQVGGNHYAKLKIQPAQYCHANGIGHLAGDAISYITRYKDKNGKQDLLKAIHSLQLLIELEYGD